MWCMWWLFVRVTLTVSITDLSPSVLKGFYSSLPDTYIMKPLLALDHTLLRQTVYGPALRGSVLHQQLAVKSSLPASVPSSVPFSSPVPEARKKFPHLPFPAKAIGSKDGLAWCLSLDEAQATEQRTMAQASSAKWHHLHSYTITSPPLLHHYITSTLTPLHHLVSTRPA